MFDTEVRIRGNNNTIIIHENCVIGDRCSFWLEGNNIKIEVGANITFTNTVHLCAQEDNSEIIIGDDGMFSNSIIIRTSDSHPIYEISTNKRINYSQNVHIGSHVWIAPNTKIMKGAVVQQIKQTNFLQII